jgi:hypothetical protein
LVTAGVFAVNATTASAGPPLPEDLRPTPPFPPLEPEIELASPCERFGICGPRIDPCLFLDCAGDPGDDPADGTDPADDPVDDPDSCEESDDGPTAGTLPTADTGGDEGSAAGPNLGVVILTALSLAGLAGAWILFFASRRRSSQAR